MTSNQTQIENWNGRTGERWAASQELIDRQLASVTEHLMRFVAPKSGERVIDIGCGAGTATFMLREAVGPDGAAAGIDISRPLLTVARARAQASQADVRFVQDDAAIHDFQPVNDLVFSRFGVMFFADPVAAFTNIRKALASGGRLNFVCFRMLEENPWAAAPLAAGRSLLPPAEPPQPHAPGPFALADKQRTQRILEEAGYASVTIDALDTVMHPGNTAEEAAETMLTIGPLATAAADADAATLTKIEDAVRKAMDTFATDDGIAPPAACWLVSARA